MNPPRVYVCGFFCFGAQALEHRLNSYGQWAELLWDMWGLLRLGIELESPALVGGFFTTEPPGKSPHDDLILFFMLLYALWELATFNLLLISFIMLSNHGVK